MARTQGRLLALASEIQIAALLGVLLVAWLAQCRARSKVRARWIEVELERAQLARVLEETAALHDAANSLNVYPDHTRLLSLACERLVRAFDAPLVAFLAITPDNAFLETEAHACRSGISVANLRVGVGDGFLGRVARYGKGAAARTDQLRAPGCRAEAPLQAVPYLVAVPFRVRAEIKGVWVVGGDMELEDRLRQSALRLYASHVAWMLDRMERHDQVARRTQMLDRANRRLADVNRKSEVFLATATHELRTPLSGIVSYAEVLSEYYDTMDDDERRPLCKDLNEQCRTMLGLVDQLFDFARLESGRLVLSLEPTSIGELVTSALDLVEPRAQEAGITLVRRVHADTVLHVDPTKIRQSLLNLLANALKFTEAGGSITVELVERGDGMVIGVADTGRGIPSEELPYIFDQYRSADTKRGRAERGLGLGLYLVKNFIDLHNGRVDVASEVAKGTQFRIFLPKAAPQAASPQAA